MVQITRPFNSTTSKRIGTAMICVGCGLFLWMLVLIYTQLRFQAQASTAVGLAKSLDPPVISFQTSSGKSVTFKQNLRSKIPSRVGEEVLVAYLPGDPQRAEMVEYMWTAPKIIAVWALMLPVFGYLTYTGRMVVGPLKKRTLVVGGE